MHKRLWLVSAVILVALGTLCVLGVYAINIHADGLQAQRDAGFLEVAENIRVDVKRKLDEFILLEQQRPYTDYQHFYVPFSSNDATALVTSPLADKFENGLAGGYFQIEPDGTIISPHHNPSSQQEMPLLLAAYNENIKKNLQPLFNGASGSGKFAMAKQVADKKLSQQSSIANQMEENKAVARDSRQRQSLFKGLRSRSQSYKIESLQEKEQATQFLNESRRVFADNTAIAQNKIISPDMMGSMQGMMQQSKQQAAEVKDDLVQVRVEPFVPITVANGSSDNEVFDGQVFLVRHIQIEDRHILQGFRLDQQKLTDEIAESAQRMLRRNMGFEIAGDESLQAVHAAVLDFGFGGVVLNLFDIDPAAISRQIGFLRKWFVAIIGVVSAATLFAVASLWRNITTQIALASKKDDFISAVSHELRTPLTSIRMYTEMLEKGWVKSDDKRSEYYVTMRQESERLSRLIENVLDFSRIQRGKKRYDFVVGDINECVGGVVDMMTPYAAQAGFTIVKQLCCSEDVKRAGDFAFDSDAISQIVINLLDNAIKYAGGASDKVIIVRTGCDDGNVIIEVEDHGPGIPNQRRKKVFEEFYRIGSESTRETTGTGLGLALVRKFAVAHNGFVDVVSVKPSGVKFMVALPLS